MRLWFAVVLLCSLPIFAEEDASEPSGQNCPILILAAKGGVFDQARDGLESELRNEFLLSTIEINEMTQVKAIEKVFSGSYHPKAVVLIGNNAIRLYVKFAGRHKELTAAIQVVSILALDIRRAVAGLNNVQGIAYETPMVTAIVNFRRVINKPLTKIGVLYRKSFQEFVDKHIEYCSKEKVIVKGVVIGDVGARHEKEIGNGLRMLIRKEHVEAIWIPNDNILLKPELLSYVWLPIINGYKMPLIVGVESLVKSELNLGTYAVIPDPQALGEQAAGIIIDLKENKWEHNGIKIYPAISMYSVLNLDKAGRINDTMKLRLNEVNKIVGTKKNR